MKMDGRRESVNVEDRRNKKNVGKAAGVGIGGIVVALLAWFFGGQAPDISSVVETVQSTASSYIDSKTEEQMAQFSKQVLASTEDFWTEEFQRMGRGYTPPKMVLYSSDVNTECGDFTAKTGPFYCSGDATVYLDLAFFMDLNKELGRKADFAHAMVIGHEVGHHVQYLLGQMEPRQEIRRRYGNGSLQDNQATVRVELQADFYAGLWAHHENERFKSLEEGDVEEAMAAILTFGDDYIQKNSKGYASPESFRHGTSEQRSRWFKKGLTTGDFKQGDTQSVPYNSL